MRRIAFAIALSAAILATASCSGGGGSPGTAAFLAPNNPAPTDTGASASLQLQIVAPMVTASPIPVQ